jgi:hypothetical protein
MSRTRNLLLAKAGPEWGPVPLRRVPNPTLTRLCAEGVLEVRLVPGPNQSGLLRVEYRLKQKD